jgi:hypothetical protein
MIAILLITLTLGIVIFYIKFKILQQYPSLIETNTGESLLLWFTPNDFKKVTNNQEKWVLHFNNVVNTLLIVFSLIAMVCFAIVLLSVA